ncbi:MAG: MAPEG family protein [Salaquimonas sp.]|nr:MAPEG family protein [Salaquimonas sp.]
MALSAGQKGVARGMAAGAAASIVLWVGAITLLPAPAIADTVAARLAFALPWQLVPLLTMLFGIAWLARYRFFHANAIDGDNPPADAALMAGRAFLENTVEQVLLTFITQMVLAVVLPLGWLQVLPALAIWFGICRVLFRLGYRGGAAARAFGFAGTFYPTVIGIAVAIWFALFG